MPLANRVTPFAELVADPARGLFMGNRGGRIHDPATRTLTGRLQASSRWICCLTAFRNRRRSVWGEGYTELFFCDEVTALAAGHRPCFECRRADARAYARAVADGLGLSAIPGVDALDRMLDRERRDGRRKLLHAFDAAALPDGAMIADDTGAALAIRGAAALPWSHAGYAAPCARPIGIVTVLTPPAMLAALRAGYRPVWHPSA